MNLQMSMSMNLSPTWKENSAALRSKIENTYHNIQYELNFKKNTVMRRITPGNSEMKGKFDCKRKVLAGDFHPEHGMVAVGSLNCFFIYLLP